MFIKKYVSTGIWILEWIDDCVLFLKFQGKVYVYDKVFKANATQESVYNTAAKPIVKGMWLEFNCLRNNAKALNDLYTAGSCKSQYR